jgi:hypothetical protein
MPHLHASMLAAALLGAAISLAPAGAQQASPQTPTPAAAPPQTEAAEPTVKDQYIEIALNGEFGTDILAKGLFEALAPARKRGVGHVVFLIDARGGQLADVEAILNVIDEFDRDFLYHGVITGRADGAVISLLAACDFVYLADKPLTGTIWGSFDLGTGPESTRAMDVARYLAVRAEKNGQPGLLYRAAIIRDVAVYLKMDEGTPRLLDAPPANPYQTLDTSDTWLGLSADQVLKAGLARTLKGGEAAAIGRVLEITGWKKSSSPGGTALMRQAANELEAMEKDVARKLDRIRKLEAAIEAAPLSVGGLRANAQDADPARLQLAYDDLTGVLTDRTQRLWKRQTDIAVDAWRQVQDRLRELEADEKAFKPAVEAHKRAVLAICEFKRWREPIPPPLMEAPKIKLDKDVEWRSAEQEIQRLTQARGRTKV